MPFLGRGWALEVESSNVRFGGSRGAAVIGERVGLLTNGMLIAAGSVSFDMMGKRLYKTYVNLTNIIVRISNGTPQGKEHALLVNAHLDSTLPSPGAADDALCIGTMMEVMRVLVETPGWSPEHAIVFCKSFL